MNVYAPVNDLSILSKSGIEYQTKSSDMVLAGGQILGDEWTDHVLKVRASILSNLSAHIPNRIAAALFSELGEYQTLAAAAAHAE